MGCNCNQTKSGAAIVYQHIVDGQTKTYATEADAAIARGRAGGRGAIIRTTQPAK